MKKRNTLKIFIFTAITCCVILSCTVIASSAHLFAASEIVNETEAASVANEISETFNGTQKTNVRVKNTGNIGAYVRVEIIPVWLDGQNTLTLKTEGTYDIVLNQNDWFKGKDGFYYCKKSIHPSQFTPELIKSCTVKDNLSSEYNGKNFDLQVLAQSVQFEPRNSVENAWKINVDDNGELYE